MKSLDEYLEIANKITDLVGEYLVGEFGKVKELFLKGEKHYSIREDKAANDLYTDFLKKNTPEVGLYTEEGEQNLDGELVWTIDPLDGTSNYAIGNPFFNTQICLLKNKLPVVAVLDSPILKQRFSAVEGQGAHLNGEKIMISKVARLDLALLELGCGSDDQSREWLAKTLTQLVKQIRTPRIFGSGGLSLAFTAASIIDLHLCSGGSIWDHAPGVLLVKEAGGVVLNLEGRQWNIEDRTLIASNSDLVEQTLKLL